MFRLPQMPLALLLATAFLPALAAPADNGPITLYYRAAITIEPDGTLTRLDWQQGEKIPASLREKLDARVHTWEFQPGTVDGQPARTESTLLLNLVAEPRANGFVVRVQNARTGAALATAPPEYPRDPLQFGFEGNVLAGVVVDPDGTRHVTIAGYEGPKRYREDFVSAVEDMFAGSEIRPERVDGHPVVAEFRVPVDFCLGNHQCGEYRWPELDTIVDGPPATAPGVAVPVGSVARLLTDVRGTGI